MPNRHTRYLDPQGTRYGLPTYPWGSAPLGLASRRKLRELGLRPGGRPVAFQAMRRRRGDRVIVHLYDIATARPLRTSAPAPLAAVSRAFVARRVCPTCDEVKRYRIPRSLGECLDCAEQANGKEVA